VDRIAINLRPGHRPGVGRKESMKAIFRKTEGDYLEATIEIDGVEIVAMDEFGGSELKRRHNRY